MRADQAVKLAPIVLFAYKRPTELRQAIRALQANHLATQSELYVFVDGPKHAADSLTCPDYYVRRMRQKFSFPTRITSRVLSDLTRLSRWRLSLVR